MEKTDGYAVVSDESIWSVGKTEDKALEMAMLCDGLEDIGDNIYDLRLLINNDHPLVANVERFRIVPVTAAFMDGLLAGDLDDVAEDGRHWLNDNGIPVLCTREEADCQLRLAQIIKILN